jgi:hypothetical protein
MIANKAVNGCSTAASVNGSRMSGLALQNDDLRIALKDYTAQTVPALDVDAYAQRVYEANRAAELLITSGGQSRRTDS